MGDVDMSSTFCNHYRAMSSHDTCGAGVPYLKFSGMPYDKRPCFRKRGEETRCGCELVQFPTAEEIAAEDKEIAEQFAKMICARQAIVNHLGGPWKRGTDGSIGVIACPVCEQPESLQFSRAGYNGHIHARCKTDGCVSWME